MKTIEKIKKMTHKDDFKTFVKSLNLSRDDYKTMMEYIDELSAIQPKQVCVATITLTDEQVKEAVEKAKNAIISVIEPEPHWIPCRKKLPEKVGAYLVQALMNDDIFVARWEGCYWGIKTPIIAWMPLPEPYKGGDFE